jgi:hypothetical protein
MAASAFVVNSSPLKPSLGEIAAPMVGLIAN